MTMMFWKMFLPMAAPRALSPIEPEIESPEPVGWAGAGAADAGLGVCFFSPVEGWVMADTCNMNIIDLNNHNIN